MYYDSTPLQLTGDSIQHTEITSRDIDRRDFPHYFLKEISEAPDSVIKTLQNRWKVTGGEDSGYMISLPESAFPRRLVQALAGGMVRRIYFVGQGTAGVAAQAAAGILDYYLDEPSLKISALKASELSGFQLDSRNNQAGMADALIIAISQSGTTTDTNRAIDMARERGALTMAIVNRRDSDLTFKVDGVVYTSSGRDIEMSVASTKAFYSQIVAGALIGLKIAAARERRSPSFIGEEIRALLELPGQMRQVLALGEQIKGSAERLATTRAYWAAVGSGPNKAAADEIRIKLSELCYKTISSDYVEDKKHIDLSSEPLIFVCAAGAPGNVIGDIVKDTAIFRAHKAVPVVVAVEGDTRFDAYAEDVFPVPAAAPHLAPILNTLAGHLWGYYAALAIDSGSRFLHQFREELVQIVDRCARNGLDIYEVVLENQFRGKVLQFYVEIRSRLAAGRLPVNAEHCADLLLLLKYLAGRLPVADFEPDFGKRGTAANMFNSLLDSLDRIINQLARPVDAIKHQAKTVTVGTSRTDEQFEGTLFDALADHEISVGQLTNHNILVLRYLQQIVDGIRGSILYKIEGLDRLGEPTDDTTITVLRKEGVLAGLPSRVETDHCLKGTKHMVVRKGHVYISKGRKDDRSIIIIPAFAAEPASGGANRIEFILLLNIAFQDNVPLPLKIRALGEKYALIKSIVQENSIAWQDRFLELVPMEELFGRSAEKIGEAIVAQSHC
jgi:glutamine---fructose-6-phosphate transaminase (isomerizing)